MIHPVEKEWEKFYSMVYPEGTPEEQARDLRTAFYSGSFVSFVLMGEGHGQLDLALIIMKELEKIKNSGLSSVNNGSET